MATGLSLGHRRPRAYLPCASSATAVPFASLLQVKRSRSKGGLAGPDGTKSVFGQMCAKMSSFSADSQLLPHRVWKVKFVGESHVQAGLGRLLPRALLGDRVANSPPTPQVNLWTTAAAATVSP